MHSSPLSEYIDNLRGWDCLTAVEGKPCKLSIVGDRLYWLQGLEQELYSVSVSDPKSAPQRVIEHHQKPLKGTAEKTSENIFTETKEEELLRERLRSRVTGVTSYRVRPGDGAVFYTSGTNMFLHRHSSGQPPLKIMDYITDNKLKSSFTSSNKPFLCMQHVLVLPGREGEKAGKYHEAGKDGDSNVITFVHGNNLYVATVKENNEGSPVPVEVNVEAVTTFGDDSHQCGTADYIIQEEFGRYTGHYATNDYVLFSYTDTSMLREISLIDGSLACDVEKMAYCRVGDPNARPLLVVYERQTKCYRVVPSSAIAEVAPWAEYIPRFGFKDDETIYLSLLSRTQEQMSVYSVPISSLPAVDVKTLAECFKSVLPGGMGAAAGAAAIASCTKINLVLESHQSIPWAWVDVLPNQPIHFGYEHEVLVRNATESGSAHFHIYVRERGAGVEAWRALTHGEWNVKPGSLRVMQDKVLFLANAKDRIESVLYSVPVHLEASTMPFSADQLTQLTPSNEHVYSFTAHNGNFCYVSSTERTPAELYIASFSEPTSRRCLETQSLGNNENSITGYKVQLPEAFVFPHIVHTTSRRGVPLSGRLFVSPHAHGEKLSPLAMYVYGGPHAQLVFGNDYDGACKPLFQLLVNYGISVLVADGQMSNANSLRDHSICKHNMGGFETDDYVDWVKYITNSSELPHGFRADPSRIAVFGWSYGGYATLLAMSQAPKVFKIGFSGAPVGDWTLYDTGYTERYMGELYESNENNETGEDDVSKDGTASKRTIREAYKKSAIGAFASGFPEELNRVFIAHGLLDENVHFSHTNVIVTSMIDAGKPFSSVIYPGERHSLRKRKISRMHYDATIVKTLVEML
ncbi:dipeptidyl-peptidase 8-like serine peptidase [Trypanosoma vivax]|nr:dipeptidyl-peptidase 8-like serine peptidase [Trypanosoma vivax]